MDLVHLQRHSHWHHELEVDHSHQLYMLRPEYNLYFFLRLWDQLA